MKCPECSTFMVRSNLNHKYVIDDVYYTKYFCFDCNTLYECTSDSGDMVEEYLDELGRVEFI